MKYDVVSIGNALMDVLVRIEYDTLLDLKLDKGTMSLIDEKRLKEIEKQALKHNIQILPGGSSANTLAMLTNLGSTVVFFGKVGNDEHGFVYEQKMIEHGVTTRITKTKGITGKVITFITPDSERTFATHLGVATTLSKDDIIEKDIKNSKILFLSGYEMEDPVLRETSLYAMELAKKYKVKIAIDLADSYLVNRTKDDLRKIIKEFADIIFANEEEAKAFTGKDADKALNELAKIADVAVIKLGEKGSLVKRKNKTYRIKSYPANCVDTTGAGDLYAAGFLHGLVNNHGIEKSAKLGSFLGAKVVEKTGARLDKKDFDKVKEFLKKLL